METAAKYSQEAPLSKQGEEPEEGNLLHWERAIQGALLDL